MSLAVSSSTCLPPLRCALGQGPSPPTHQYLPSFSSFSGVVKRERIAESSEEDDALPLLMSMAQIQTNAASESSRLPTISSILPSLPTFAPSQFSQMAPSASLADRSSSSSPVPQSSPPSPSTLPPGLFGSYSLISTSSASSTSFGPASSSMPSTAPHQQAYVPATNRLMELSDIISSTPALHQKLPVPSSACVKAERSNDSEGEDADADNGEYVDSDGHAPCDSPVSSRTRRVTRSQQKQIDRIQTEIELERDRARELEQTLQLALRERSKLLAEKLSANRQLSGGPQGSFVNVLNTEDGSQQVVFVDPSRTHSVPSLPLGGLGDAPRLSSEGRSRSASMLPPIASIPGLSPYLSRKRGSLPASPMASPLRPSMPTANRDSAETACARGLSRRRKSVDREDADEDYEPTSAAKKIKRTRSMSEGGRRLQGVSNTRRRRSESQYRRGGGGEEDLDHGHVAAAFMAMRAKAIEERYARESRQMDVVEGADQEDDEDYAEYCEQQQQQQQRDAPSRVAMGTHARRDSVLDFIKDHPHASFWLKARN